ncbi:MAG: hypothetical protein ACE5FG_11030 [Myxococcota bacterium]
MLIDALRARGVRFLLHVLAAVSLVALGVTPAQALPLINGDFEAGLSGWDVFQTDGGETGTVSVVSFETVAGVSSNAAELNVGETTLGTGFQGGGIEQLVSLGTGTLSVSADIASFKLPRSGLEPFEDDNHGGLFELLVDDVVRDSFDFDFVLANQIHRGTLAFSDLVVTAGLHRIAIRVTRPFQNDVTNPLSPTPREYIDNVVLGFKPVEGSTVPEPPAWLLLALGLIPLTRRRAAASA